MIMIIVMINDIMYDDGKSMFMVMELMRGGELLDRILKHKSLSEREAAVIMHTLASTFTFLHEEGVGLTKAVWCPEKYNFDWLSRNENFSHHCSR